MRECDAKLVEVFSRLPATAVMQLARTLADADGQLPRCDESKSPKSWHHSTRLQRLLIVASVLTSEEVASLEAAIVEAAKDGTLSGGNSVLRLIRLNVQGYYANGQSGRLLCELLDVLSQYRPSHLRILIDRFREDAADYDRRYRRSAGKFADTLDKLVSPDPARDAALRRLAGMVADLPNRKLGPLAAYIQNTLNPPELADTETPLDDRLPDADALTPQELELLILYSKLDAIQRETLTRDLAELARKDGAA